MATKYGEDAKNYDIAKTSGQKKYFRQAHDVNAWKESYTFDGTEVVGDVVLLSRDINPGTMFMPVLSRIHVIGQPAATAFTASIGIAGVANNLMPTTSLNTVGLVNTIAPEFELIDAAQIKLTIVALTGAVAVGAKIDFYFVVRQTS